jgi:Tol biopolymer transport system component
MKVRLLLAPLALGLFVAGSLSLSTPATHVASAQAQQTTEGPAQIPEEKHLRNVKQLTFGGENAEAYFSGDGKQLIFQSKRETRECDQIYTMNADGSDQKMVSTGG